jgi:ATP-dependent Zn protease
LGRSLAMGDKYSEKIKDTMDRETLELVTYALNQAKDILTNNREGVTKMVDILLNSTTIQGDVFIKNMM